MPSNQFDAMGYSIRTPEWRYTRWILWNKTKLVGEWDGDYADELYNHVGDDGSNMDLYENLNMVSSHPNVVKQLSQQLRNFFDKS